MSPDTSSVPTESLTSIEQRIFDYLKAKAGTPVSAKEIYRDVWGRDPEQVVTSTVFVHLSNLRRKLAPGAILRTKGKGYSMS